jgi:ferredoxin-NADP reductase/nitrite reductase/ring-hydroxylating ferredoxin subunit
MARHVVARAADIPAGSRLIVEVQGRSVGIFNVDGRFHALLNRCPHQGAELCRGSILGHLDSPVPGDITYDGTRKLLQCPWHGWEYDMATGQSYFDSRVRSYPVDVRVGDAAEVAGLPAEDLPATLAAGSSAKGLVEGPYKAETFPLSVEDSYIVLDMPGSGTSRRDRAATHDAPKLELRVERIEPVAEDVVAVVFAHPGGEELPVWEPGAHVDVGLGPEIVRQYSLCGDPTRLDTWRVAVLREPDSRGGSSWVHDSLRPGDIVPVVGPRNNFPLVDADRHLFVAGGIGITPFLPMIATLAARGADWRLLYGGRRRATMAFVDELAVHGDRVTVWPEDSHGLLELPALLADPEPGTAVYCCGPEPLLAAVEQSSAHWPADSLHVERFHPKPGALEGKATPFDVVLDRSGTTVHVPADRTIVEALAEAGVEVPTSCREGTCGTCETGLVAGVPDHRDSFLTDEEREAGDTVMVCCSRSFSPELVLDL